MENSYSLFTDEELFKLWKDIDTDIKYNEENGISDSSEYDLSLVGQELVKRKYMLDEEEYNAIDYHLEKSKLYESGFYIAQENNKDYFIDEEGKYTLEEGLRLLYDTFMGSEKEYPNEIKEGLKRVYKRFLNIDLEV